MQQVITVSLDGSAYQVEENGYDALRKYLNRARNGLRGNPDVDEILGDLERSIAEKCNGAMKPGKTVVSSSDMEQILRETGPVAEDFSGEPEPDGESPHAPPVKRLSKKREGAFLAGVSTGLADYFNVDVLIVRALFAIFTLMTGIGLLLYLILAIAMQEDPSPVSSGSQPALNISKVVFQGLTIISAILMILLGLMILIPRWSSGSDVDYGRFAHVEMGMGRIYAAPLLLMLGALAVLIGRTLRSSVPLVMSIPVLLYGLLLVMDVSIAEWAPFMFIPFAILFLPFVPLLAVMVIAVVAACVVRYSRSTTH